jgi:Tol biopolymer transport system component
MLTEADGSKPLQMTHNLGRHQGSPRWSPDGRWIAFNSQGPDGHHDIYVMDASGGDHDALLRSPRMRDLR